MARKLTPEELNRYSADFDIPAGLEPLTGKKKASSKKEKATGATKKQAGEPKKADKATKKAGDKETGKETKKAAKKAVSAPVVVESASVDRQPSLGKHPGGRPAAFKSEVQIVTLKLPPADVIKLKVKAAEQGKTMAQVIHDWLN